MTEDMLDLARRAVACRGWRWMLGCRVAHIEYGDITTDGRGTYLGNGMQPGDMCIHWDDHAPRGLSSNWSTPQNFRPEPHVFDYCIPDLTDPATLGCLLALVREAWGDKAVIHIENNNWFYVETDGRHLWDEDNASSLLAALVAALEAA